MAHPAAGHRVVPRVLHAGGVVDLALALARAAHHRLDDARVADALRLDGGPQLSQRIAKRIPARGQLERLGREAADALAVHRQAARARLRPILMTSFAFILGVLPLVLASGPGWELRQALGTAVFFGMIGVTFFGLIFTPVFYVALRSWGNRPDTRPDPELQLQPAE